MKLKELLKGVWKYLRNDKKLIVVYAILSFLVASGGLAFPIIYGQVIEILATKKVGDFISVLLIYTGISIFLGIIVEFLWDYIFNLLQKRFMKRVTNKLMVKTLDLPAVAYEERGVGELVNRTNNDPETVIVNLKDLVDIIFRVVVTLIIVVYLFTVSKLIFLEMLVFIVYVYLMSKFFLPKIRKKEEEIKKDTDKYASESTQFLTGIREVRALGIKARIKDIIKFNIERIQNGKYASNMIGVKYFNLLWLGFFVLEFVITLTAGMYFLDNVLTMAVFIAIGNFLFRIHTNVEMFAGFGVNLEKIKISMRRIMELTENKLYSDVEYGNKVLSKSYGKIDFCNVKFGYGDNHEILKGLNLSFEPNKKIAIVGKSGNGKSTIFNLLLRYFDVSSGSIFIDGVDIRELSEEELGKAISIIRQEPYIFNKSIKENFKLLNDNIATEEIRDCCKKASIDDYIMSLPKGYDTLIGEGGVNLSGGQKQRLAIARALVKDSKIILFDEATSALDNISQAAIKETIDELSKTRTVIMIAHRLSTIEDADEIIVIDNGKVSGIGKHDDLLNENNTYISLYRNSEL